MKKVLPFLAVFICLYSFCFSQSIRQFGTAEVVSLFDKTQANVYKYMSDKNYSFIGKEVGFDKFIAKTQYGVFHVDMFFKNGKLNSISTSESFQIARMIPLDLAGNFFNLTNSFNGETEIIPYEGCIYGLKNKKLGLMASYIISRANPLIVVVNYSRDPNNVVIGNLSLKLKTLKAAIEKEENKHEETEAAAQLKEKIENNTIFRDYETLNKPYLIVKDTTGLKSFIINCVQSQGSNSYTLRINYDTSPKAIKCDFSKAVTSGYSQSTNDVSYRSTSCSETEILDNINKFFTLNNTGKVHYNGKDVAVPISYDISVVFHARASLTKQIVNVKKTKSGFNIDMRKSNSFDGGEESLIERNQFNDDSYIQKIKDYITGNPPADLSRYHYGITYYAIKTLYKVEIVYQYHDEQTLTFDFDTWKIQQAGAKNLYNIMDN